MQHQLDIHIEHEFKRFMNAENMCSGFMLTSEIKKGDLLMGYIRSEMYSSTTALTFMILKRQGFRHFFERPSASSMHINDTKERNLFLVIHALADNVVLLIDGTNTVFRMFMDDPRGDRTKYIVHRL